MRPESHPLAALLEQHVKDQGLVTTAPAIARALACAAQDQESRRFLARVLAVVSKELRDRTLN